MKDFEIAVCYDAEMKEVFIECGVTNCAYMEANTPSQIAEAVKDFIKEYIIK